jgi:hypothetical protein
MKHIILAALWMIVSPVMAQKHIEKTISVHEKQFVEVNVEIADSISIETWNRPEIQIIASVNINDNADNDAYEISFNEGEREVIIKAGIKKDYFHVSNYCKGLITWKIIIPENKPFHVETINGNITIKGKTAKINAKSISGFIDLELPSDCKASLEMKTLMGKIYSDLELGNQTSDYHSPESVSTDFNGGGIPVTLETITGDIFCRGIH